MSYASAAQMRTDLAARKVSARELAQAAIDRIEALDGPLNAVVVRDFERALTAADAADDALARGEDRPLLGVPITVKEAFDVAELPTTWGLPGVTGTASRDATAVARLKRAGAVVVGKTNIALMLQDWQSDNPAYGRANNPWDVARTAGGSSGGGAAALAAGFVPLEYGSDLGGSLRLPAAFCGVMAHRPTWGITPHRGFAPPGAPDLPVTPAIDMAVVGPLARTAEDLETALKVTAGRDGRDAMGWRLDLPAPGHAALKDHRVLVIDAHPLTATAASIRGALNDLAARLETAGCQVARASPLMPDLAAVPDLFLKLLFAALSADSPQPGGLSHADWLDADRERLAIAGRLGEVFGAFDVVLTPVAITTAFAHDARPFDERRLDVDGESRAYGETGLWTCLAGLTGHPATTAPIGMDDAGLPIGVQIIGPYLEDLTPIAFAGWLERELGGFRPPPGY
jgi:amidase